jgi:hypothetical protein
LWGREKGEKRGSNKDNEELLMRKVVIINLIFLVTLINQLTKNDGVVLYSGGEVFVYVVCRREIRSGGFIAPSLLITYGSGQEGGREIAGD